MTCSWDNPGADPYRGPVETTVAAAVARYEFPKPVQAVLVAKVRRLDNDAIVRIPKDGLYSPTGTAAGLRDMHFGKDRMCSGPVARTKWTADRTEVALVYCEQGYCIAMPVICGNVSRIDFTRTPRKEPDVRSWGPAFPPIAPLEVPEPGTLTLAGLALALMKGLHHVQSKDRGCRPLRQP